MLRQLLPILLLLASGGSLAQESVKQPDADAKVVLLLNVVEADVTNSHLGTTIFTNYEKKLGNDWNVHEWTGQRVAELFSEGGYRVVTLKVPEDRVEAIRSYKYVKTGWSAFKLEPGFANWLWAEMDRAGATHAFVLQDFAKQFAFDVPVKYSGYGVMSLHGKKPKRAFLYANVGSHFIMRGQAELPKGVRAGDADCRLALDVSEIQVQDFEELTANDLLPYREKIQGLIEKRIRQDLTFAKAIPGDFVKCETGAI